MAYKFATGSVQRGDIYNEDDVQGNTYLDWNEDADYTSIQSGISEDGLTFTVSFYDVNGTLAGTRTVNIESQNHNY